jgi:hypothetical protein
MKKETNETKVKNVQTNIHEVNATKPIGEELTDEKKQELHVKDGQNNHNVDERGGY